MTSHQSWGLTAAETHPLVIWGPDVQNQGVSGLKTLWGPFLPLPTLGAAGDPGQWLPHSASASVVDWPGSLQVSLLHVSLIRTSHWMIQDALVLRSLMSFLCKNLFPNKVPFTGSRVSMWTHLWGPHPMDPLLWEDCREPWSPAWPLTQLCAALTRQSSVLGALQGGWTCSVLVLPSQVPSAQHSRFWGTAVLGWQWAVLRAAAAGRRGVVCGRGPHLGAPAGSVSTQHLM